jgi:hypothetical protein
MKLSSAMDLPLFLNLVYEIDVLALLVGIVAICKTRLRNKQIKPRVKVNFGPTFAIFKG